MNDGELIQIVDAALAEAARKSGPWLVCRAGCAQCCIGAFAISGVDVDRLHRGLAALAASDPDRAARVRQRARESVERTLEDFPGDAVTGILDEGGDAEARFDEFANEEPCPALDPESLTCDLYASRPLTCRTFGPALRVGSGAIAACELCYEGATEEEVEACAIDLDVQALDPDDGDVRTTVAFALR